MRALLLFLLFAVAITALPCGVMLVLEPDGSILQLPLILLNATPFNSFLIPGIILTIMVGGTNAIAFMLVVFKKPYQYRWSMAAGTILVLWIIAQFMLISGAHWLQLFYMGLGVLTVLIAYQLRGKWAV